MNMKRMVLAMGIAAVALEGVADSQEAYYSFGKQNLAVLRVPRKEGGEPWDWAVSNANYASAAGAYFLGADTNTYDRTHTAGEDAAAPTRRIDGAIYGQIYARRARSRPTASLTRCGSPAAASGTRSGCSSSRPERSTRTARRPSRRSSAVST